MEAYNYKAAVKGDIWDWLDENKEYIEYQDRESLCDDLFIADSVTGNASGSYTYNRYKAEDNLAHNLALLQQACAEFGCVPNLENPEACDVTIRCYLLLEVFDSVYDEWAAMQNDDK